MTARTQKNAGKMPAMQFYPADWRKDPGVQALGFHDRGVWFEILCIMHESSERGVLLLNGLPMPTQALANILGLDIQILNQTLTNLTTYGVAKVRHADGALYSKRMVADENLCQIRREAGKKGGNPALLNQKSNQADNQAVNQTATPSSSSSSSSSSSTTVSKPLSPAAQSVESECGPVQASLIPGEQEGKQSAVTKAQPVDADFEAAWGIYPKRAGGNSKTEALKAWTARVKQGKKPDDMIAGVMRYAKFCAAKGNIGTEYVKQASTFFGPSLHFEEAWDIPVATERPQSGGFMTTQERNRAISDANMRAFLEDDGATPFDALPPPNDPFTIDME
ncbi:hypothetical protein [Paraburkholderia bryophila]|uniref:Phage replisome organizer n=1 Tax=Paraburkholderia bryophila TaxID=420952 RepID=A0A7Y9WQT9_9BURK|nr:hypothetical protein [Paraburkholderia bryophila]NYH24675.1 hypothetical protein [Paraburkholderia bryophila]